MSEVVKVPWHKDPRKRFLRNLRYLRTATGNLIPHIEWGLKYASLTPPQRKEMETARAFLMEKLDMLTTVIPLMEAGDDETAAFVFNSHYDRESDLDWLRESAND